MDLLLGGVSKTIRAMSRILGSWSFTRNLADDVAKVGPYWQKANYFLPFSDVLTVLGLFIGLNLALIAYYWITRAINLLRGAG